MTRAGKIVALLLVAPLAPAAGAPLPGPSGHHHGLPQQTGRQGSFIGPAEGETLEEWTRRWLEGPVQVIATSEERDLYAELSTTQERLEFIRLFWERRDTRLRGPANEYLEEFERRVAYADEEFGNGNTPGWQTVFGRIVLVFGPPSRTRRELGLPPGLSDRPPILWTYDRRLPEIPPNEDLLFVFQRGKWRLMPPSPLGASGIDEERRALERSGMLAEIPSDFERAMDVEVEATLLNPVDYRTAIDRVEATVAFPDQEIPFGWDASFTPGDGDTTRVGLRLTWRMGSLIFHVVDGDFQTEMQVRAVLLDDGEPVAETSDHISVRVPAAELQARGEEIVAREITLEAAPGTYTLELTLDDQLVGYRTRYRDTFEVPRQR